MLLGYYTSPECYLFTQAILATEKYQKLTTDSTAEYQMPYNGTPLWIVTCVHKNASNMEVRNRVVEIQPL